jgi:excisionase family DNA binding protein
MPRKPAPTDPLVGVTPDQTITITEASTRLGVSRRFLLAAIKNGSLPAFLPGGKTDPTRSGALGYRIKTEDLRAWFFGR